MGAAPNPLCHGDPFLWCVYDVEWFCVKCVILHSLIHFEFHIYFRLSLVGRTRIPHFRPLMSHVFNYVFCICHFRFLKWAEALLCLVKVSHLLQPPYSTRSGLVVPSFVIQLDRGKRFTIISTGVWQNVKAKILLDLFLSTRCQF